MKPRQPRALLKPELPKYIFLAEWIGTRGLSAEQLADEIGVTRQTVYKWIDEQHRIDLPKLSQIAKALNTSVPKLFRLPSTRDSIDEFMAHFSDDDHTAIMDIAKRYTERKG